MNGNTPTLISVAPKRTPSRAMTMVTGKSEAEGTGQHVAVRDADHGLCPGPPMSLYSRVEAVQSGVLADRRGVAGETPSGHLRRRRPGRVKM